MPADRTGDRWTAEDVERVAKALWSRTGRSGEPEDFHFDARTALRALADAGRLQDPGGVHEWGVSWDDWRGVSWRRSEQDAKDHAQATNGHLWRRWVGPWQPVQPEKTKP